MRARLALGGGVRERCSSPSSLRPRPPCCRRRRPSSHTHTQTYGGRRREVEIRDHSFSADSCKLGPQKSPGPLASSLVPVCRRLPVARRLPLSLSLHARAAPPALPLHTHLHPPLDQTLGHAREPHTQARAQEREQVRETTTHPPPHRPSISIFDTPAPDTHTRSPPLSEQP